MIIVKPSRSRIICNTRAASLGAHYTVGSVDRYLVSDEETLQILSLSVDERIFSKERDIIYHYIIMSQQKSPERRCRWRARPAILQYIYCM
jgi:hypothetical protein